MSQKDSALQKALREADSLLTPDMKEALTKRELSSEPTMSEKVYSVVTRATTSDKFNEYQKLTPKEKISLIESGARKANKGLELISPNQNEAIEFLKTLSQHDVNSYILPSLQEVYRAIVIMNIELYPDPITSSSDSRLGKFSTPYYIARVKEEVAKTEEQRVEEWKANYLRETTIPATPIEQKTNNGNLLVSKGPLWNNKPEQLVWARDKSNTIEVDLATITQLEEDTAELFEELSNIDFRNYTAVFYEASTNKEMENQPYTIYISPTIRENGRVIKDAEEYIEKVTSAIKSYIKLLDVRQKAREYLKKQPEVASYALGMVNHTLDMFLAEMDEVTYPDDTVMAIVHTTSKLLTDEVSAGLVSRKGSSRNLTIKAMFVDNLAAYVQHIDSLNCNLTYKEQNGLYQTILDMETESMMDQYGHDYSQAKQVLAKWYVCNLESFINQEIVTDITGLYPDVKLTPLGISSPREYNFETDIVLLATNDVPVIYKALMLSNWDTEWKEWVKRITTSYDGYLAFYTKADFDKPVHKWKDAQKCAVLDFMAFLMDREGEIQELEYEYDAYSEGIS